MPTFPVTNGYLHYQVQGSGPTLLLILGLGRSSRHWLGYDQILAQYFQVITVDARGTGLSTADVSWSLTINQMADDYVRLLKFLGIRSAHFVGVSLGGMVALAMALLYPDQTASITVVNASIAGSRYPRLTPKALAALAANLLGLPAARDRLAKVLLASGTRRAKRKEVARQWQTIDQEEGRPILTVCKQLIAASRFKIKRLLPHLKVPILVVVGADDQFVPARNSEIIHKLIPQAEFRSMDRAGHELVLDQPGQFAEILRQFVAKQKNIPNVS